RGLADPEDPQVRQDPGLLGRLSGPSCPWRKRRDSSWDQRRPECEEDGDEPGCDAQATDDGPERAKRPLSLFEGPKADFVVFCSGQNQVELGLHANQTLDQRFIHQSSPQNGVEEGLLANLAF